MILLVLVNYVQSIQMLRMQGVTLTNVLHEFLEFLNLDVLHLHFNLRSEWSTITILKCRGASNGW